MKTGAWIEVDTGRWHLIDDHADWIRRPECSRTAGLPEEVVLRIAAMPRKQRSGSERTAILLEAMKYGLIRFRGHGAEVMPHGAWLPVMVTTCPILIGSAALLTLAARASKGMSI